MTSESNKKWNDYIDRMVEQVPQDHVVNLKEFLQNLKHCATAVVQDSGQRYTYVQMEDLDHAISGAVKTATESKSDVIQYTRSDFESLNSPDFCAKFREVFHSSGNATSLAHNSRGCATVQFPSSKGQAQMGTDTLDYLIMRYDAIVMEGDC